MPNKHTPGETNADDLFKLLDEYRCEYNGLSDNQTPKDNAQTDETEMSIHNENEMIKHAEQAWASHFGEAATNGTNDEKKYASDISAHLSDSIPEAIADFSEHTENDKDMQAQESDDINGETENPVKPADAPDDKEKPWPIKLLLSIASFFWNLGFVVKAVVYIVIVLIISSFLSYYIIAVGNDVFAFVKTDREVTINIDEDMTRKEVAYLLEKNGIIEYSWAFNLFMIYRDDESESFLEGEHTVSSSMNYSQIISELTEEAFTMKEVSVTIPEGFTTDQIIDLLVVNGIGTREDFVDAINNYPYKHEFVKLLDENGYPETRKYRLEGYLYPDTYFFYTDSEEYLVINKLLNNFNDRVWIYYDSTFKADIETLGMSFDDIVTLASMVQSEAKLFTDFECISYVFHNRLNSSDPQFKKLQSDATVQYCLPEHVEDLTQEQIDTDNPYNTYVYDGLPPGAICNPGFDAISAAIYPDAPLDGEGLPINAYFFVSNKAGETYYAMTKTGHDANKMQVEKDNAAFTDENT